MSILRKGKRCVWKEKKQCLLHKPELRRKREGCSTSQSCRGGVQGNRLWREEADLMASELQVKVPSSGRYILEQLLIAVFHMLSIKFRIEAWREMGKPGIMGLQLFRVFRMLMRGLLEAEWTADHLSSHSVLVIRVGLWWQHGRESGKISGFYYYHCLTLTDWLSSQDFTASVSCR